MMMYIRLLFFILLLIPKGAFAQVCESWDRNLFKILPDSIPEFINCIDSNGLKQGWWIYYKVEENLDGSKEDYPKGLYIEKYLLGRYRNHLKLGEWMEVHNVHTIFIASRTRYYYAKDTLLVTKKRFLSDELSILYNADSSVIKSEVYSRSSNHPVIIDCDKNREVGKECTTTYRGEVLHVFPYELFLLETYVSKEHYDFDKNRIDLKFKE